MNLGSGETFLRDREGREVVSALDPESLRDIAETTGGDYVAATSAPRPLLDLYEDRILPAARRASEADDLPSRRSGYQWPLLTAFLLWFLALALTDRKRP